MIKAGDFLTKHKNAFLGLILLLTLVISGLSARNRLAEAPSAISIPVVEAAASGLSPMDVFRQEREQTMREDMAALQALCDQDDLASTDRSDAASRLQSLVECREAQLAIEGALVQSSLSPCVAVVSPGKLTLVTGKASISERDTALVTTLAMTHAGVSPAGVQIITAEN